jgi:hypothetical protein
MLWTGEKKMTTISEWWHRRRERKRGAKPISRVVNEDGIVARVDMVRLEALAEAAYDAKEAEYPAMAGLYRRLSRARGLSS